MSWREREALRQGMDEVLRRSRGVTLIELRFTDFELPEDVIKQRNEVLQAELSSRIKRLEGNAAAQLIYMREETRAKVQQELISSIADNLNRVDQSNFADSMLLTLSSILSQGLNDPTTLAYLAQETFETLDSLRKYLDPKDNNSSRGD